METGERCPTRPPSSVPGRSYHVGKSLFRPVEVPEAADEQGDDGQPKLAALKKAEGGYGQEKEERFCITRRCE